MQMKSTGTPGIARDTRIGAIDVAVSDTGPFLRQEGRNPASPRSLARARPVPGRLGMPARRNLERHPPFGDGPVAFAWIARLASSMRRAL